MKQNGPRMKKDPPLVQRQHSKTVSSGNAGPSKKPAQMFRKRKGTTDKGKDYEDYVVAKFVLDLMTDETIQDFRISSNNEDYGAFDDVVLEVQNEDTTIDKYAFQLKHFNNSKSLSWKSFLEAKGNFSLQKYFESFLECEDHFSDCKLILSTNSKFNGNQTIELEINNCVLKLQISASEVPPLLSKCGIKNHIHKFEVIEYTAPSSQEIKKYDSFFDCFLLCTNQSNVDQVKRNILDKLKEFNSIDTTTVDYFLKFIKEWGMPEGKKKKLTKKIMKEIMALHLSGPYMHPIIFNNVTKRAKLLQQVILKYHLTVFKEDVVEKVKKIFGDSQSQLKNIPRLNELRKIYQFDSTYQLVSKKEELTKEECAKLLWILDVCPLIVTINERTQRAFELCSDKKFICIGTDTEVLQTDSVFRNLSDLNIEPELLQEIKQTFQCSLPIKENKSLNYLCQLAPTLEKFVTTHELLQMTDQPYAIYEKVEELPFPCINRLISKNIIDLKYLETVDNNTLIVISNVKNKEEISRYLKKNFVDSLDEDQSRKSHIYVVEKEVPLEEFEEVCERKKNMKRYHHFTIEDGKLEWLKSLGDILDLSQFRINTNFESETSLLNISKFQNNVVIISDEPGKGKSVLLKNLKNSLSSRIWTILLSSAEIREFHKNYKHDFENFLFKVKYPKFTDFEKQILKIALQNNQMIYMWDALDEVDAGTLETVTNFISNHFQNNSVHFLTCRIYLKKFLEKKFCTLSRNIDHFNDEQQRFYIEERLRPSYPNENFGQLMETIKKYFEFSKPRDFLGVPLQIYMLTELLLEDKNKDFNLLKNIFSVADLYEYFIENKLKLSYKFDTNEYTTRIFNNLKMHKIEFYQELALMTLFEDALGINIAKITQKMTKENDTFGFFTYDENTSTFNFVHNSYAEYFAATYFAENLETIPNLKNILFNVKYTNVRFFFDLLFAKNSPGHIAILHKNFKTLKQLELSYKDSGGRNILHLLCSWGERYPVLDVQEKSNTFVLDDENINIVSENSEEYEHLLEYLLRKCDIEETDKVFNMDALSYAEYGECLLTIAFIEKKYKLGYFKNKHYSVSCSTLYYSVLLDRPKYIDLFKDIKFLELKFGISLLHIAVQNQTEESLEKLLSFKHFSKNINYDNGDGLTPFSFAYDVFSGNDKIIELLLISGATIDTKMSGRKIRNSDNKFPLHSASSYGREKFVKYLINQKKDINVVDDIHRTALFLSCAKGHYGVAKLLLENGADINIADEDGRTPLHIAILNGHNKLVELLTNSDSVCLDTLSVDQELEQLNELLIKSQEKTNVSDNNQLTTLYLACLKGYEKIVSLLIQSQADVNAVNENGYTPLHVACHNGHESIVEMLIKSQADVNAVNKNGDTPLYMACQNGHESIVELLIKSQADVNATDEYGETPLHAACQSGNENIVELLIKSQADVNAANKDGYTPLYMACGNGHESLVELLIKSKADVNAANNHGFTPLCLACQYGHKSIVELLIKSQVDKHGFTPLYASCQNGHESIVELLLTKFQHDVNSVNKDGDTLLYVACWNGHESVVELLIKSQGDVNAADKYGATPLFAACKNGHESVVDLLIKSQADVNAADEDAFTPLHVACQDGHENIVELLIKSQADVNAVNKEGLTPLFMACQNGHESVVELLIKCQADVNAADKDAFTPLYMACQNGHENIVELLIKSEAVVNAANKNGFTPLFVACKNGHETVVELLIKSQADVSAANKDGLIALFLACRNGHENIVALLIKSQADVNAVDKYGATPFFAACKNGHESVVELLIKSQADVNAADKDGFTPLFLACYNGHERVVDLLIKSQADVNAANKDEVTPLHVACQNGHKSIVELLIKSQADVNSANKNGVTPFFVACRNGYESVVELLFSCGIEVDCQDKDSTTPLIEACCHGHYDTVSLLIKNGANINHVDKDGVTPLGAAWHNKHGAIADLLIKHGSDLRHIDTDYYSTPLYAHCEYGYLPNIQSFIKMGADVNTPVYNGWRPIHIACFKGHTEIVKELLISGADCSVCTSAGELPLDLIHEENHMDIIKLIQDYESK